MFDAFVWIRVVANVAVVISLSSVLLNLRGRGRPSRITGYTMLLLAGVLIYNLGAGLWFVLTSSGVVSPSRFWFSHTYTIFNLFEAVPAVLLVLYLKGKIE